MSSSSYEAVIGLEVHAQLKTNSKIFSSDSAQTGGADNENVSVVSCGLPGSLPVLNKKAVQLGIRAGLALNCRINTTSFFVRKNYFYPDLPKGYQISQSDRPLCEEGYVEFTLQGQKRKVRIARAHLEEDAGKSTHHGEFTLINLNRAGTPLLEIVTGPDLRSAQEAAEYARMLRTILRYVDACDGNLEEGSLRCDCNVSVRPAGSQALGTRVEIKNINSFRFIEKAIQFEIDRQIDVIESGGQIIQETRLWDADKNRTFTMRTKEDAQDYRYFPDPDLPVLMLQQSEIDQIRQTLPELPAERWKRFSEKLGLPDQDCDFLTAEKEIADFFEETARISGAPKESANWIMSDLTRELKDSELGFHQSRITPTQLAELIRLIADGKISGKIAKTVFVEMWKTQDSAEAIVNRLGLSQVSDPTKIEAYVDEVIAKNQPVIQEYKSGKQKSFGFLVGAVMKLSQGKANPDLVNEILKKKLAE
jgi:aspartyl-tRNA(Asn)/glutamyl-tRNA(Gln) amidotransferase subunit B